MKKVHKSKPFIGEYCFDDTYGMPTYVRTELIFSGMIFSTEFTAICSSKNIEAKFGGHIIARDWNHAELRATERGLGEDVVGTTEAIFNC